MCFRAGVEEGPAESSAKEPGRWSVVPIAEEPAGSGELQTEAVGPSGYRTHWPQSLGILFASHSSLLSFQTLTCFSCIVQLQWYLQTLILQEGARSAFDAFFLVVSTLKAHECILTGTCLFSVKNARRSEPSLPFSHLTTRGNQSTNPETSKGHNFFYDA